MCSDKKMYHILGMYIVYVLSDNAFNKLFKLSCSDYCILQNLIDMITQKYMYICTGIVLVVAIICGSGKSQCIITVEQPSSGIADGVEINSKVEIACKCDSDTVQLESWYFNNSVITLIQSSHLPYAIIRPDGYVTLTIPKFTPSFAGNYTCSSSNREKFTHVELTVSQQCKNENSTTVHTCYISYKN